MSEPLIGEIRLFPFPQPPSGWLRCDGQLLTRSQYADLFQVVGTLYGGDAHTTFAVPNLQGRVALHPGSGVCLGDRRGEETHALTLAEMPNHTHLLAASSSPSTNAAQQHFWSTLPAGYSTTREEPDAALAPQALASAGDGEPHTNLQPYLVANYCIAVTGALPRSEGAAVACDGMLGEVRLFAGSALPSGWAACDGQLMSISEQARLYAIIGTAYGGDGNGRFALPDLRGRVPLHEGHGPGLSPRSLAQSGGDPDVMLTQSELPMHSHVARCASGTSQSTPDGALWSSAGRDENAFATSTDNTLMNPRAVEFVGGNAAHNNMQPYLGLNYIVALDGALPKRASTRSPMIARS